MSLFPTVHKEVELIASSKKVAFYKLIVMEEMGEYTVIKESGAAGKVLDVRRWPMENVEKAEKKFETILKNKLNPNRNNPRKYIVVAS